MSRVVYKGFSTHEFVKRRTFRLTDLELVKMDLLNFIYTPVGSRLNMPTFGTIIPLLPFEPYDDDVVDVVRSELKRAIDYDPRLDFIAIDIDADISAHTLTASLTVRYVELNMNDVIYLNIDLGNVS